MPTSQQLENLINTLENTNAELFSRLCPRATPDNSYKETPPDFQETAEWSCTCPDFRQRHATCKHIYFVLIKRLGLSEDAQLDEVKVAVSTKLAIGAELPADSKQRKKIEQREWKGSDCAICCEVLGDEEPVVWCQQQCGNTVHQLCFEQWTKVKGKVCVYCRAKWL